MGSASPYPTIVYWPDGVVNMKDENFVIALFNKRECQVGWNYMGDPIPDKVCNMKEINVIITNFNHKGTYLTDLTDITVKFDGAGGVHPNADGYISIPAGATSFVVYNGTQTVMALVTFYTQSLPAQLSQSASPSSPQYYGTSVTFSCNYQFGGSPVTGATVYVNINGTDYQAVYNASSGNYTYTNSTLPVGNNNWYCNASALGYQPQAGASEIYTINAISTKLTQSVSPPSPQGQGTLVRFNCFYYRGLMFPIVNATVYVNINGTNYLATYNASDWNYTYSNSTLPVGNNTWYCNASATGFQPQVGSPQTYTIISGFCDITWTANTAFPGDFKTDHFAAVIKGNVHVAVKLTDAAGNPVRGVSITIIPPTVIGLPQLVTSNATGIASATFSPLPANIGSYYSLNTTAPACAGGIPTKTTLDSYINAFHDLPFSINVTSNKTIAVNPGDLYNISFEILDQFGNICNSSYDGTPYNSSGASPYNATIALNQTLMNSTNKWTKDPVACSTINPGACFVVFNNSDVGGIEGKYTFQLYAYIPDPGTNINNITNYLYEVNFIKGANLASSTFTPTGKLTKDNVTVIYKKPTPPPTILKVIAQPHQIGVNDSFNITIEAVYPNQTIDKTNNDIVEVQRLARVDMPQVTNIIINNSCKLVNGKATFNVTSANSLSWFGYTGLYTLYALDILGPLHPGLNGVGTLLVGAGGIDHLKVTIDRQGVFRTLPFYATVYVVDVGNNTVDNFTGDVSIVCPAGSTDPAQQNASLTPDDRGKTTFSFIAEQSGTITCTAYAYDSVKKRLVSTTFSVIVSEPLMCTPYAIPPIVPSTPPLDRVIDNSIVPPINEVVAHNEKIGPQLVGWDGTQMNGNYSICLESYHVGRLCVNSTDIQFDKVPISVCVKEFVYNPETDAHISDHINYNGSTDFDASFRYPQIVWGWGYNASSETYSACGMGVSSGNKYSVKLTPGQVYKDFFNVTITLPLGPLQPYNITNNSVLSPHELHAPSGLIVLDERNNGRLAKFTLPTPPNPASFLEEYNKDINGTNARSITYDNRGNIYVALTGVAKILVLRVTESYPPTITFLTEINVLTKNGTMFQPYGMDTDSWGNIYVVGNTNPDQPDNMMCINKYNNTFNLIDSNDCCGNKSSSGKCSEKYEGTVPAITVNEAGTEVYIVKDKKRTCSNLGLNCFWTGNPYIYEYNSSNVSQSITNFTIYGADSGFTLWSNNPNEKITDGPCYNDAGNTDNNLHGPSYDSPDDHFLRAIKMRKGLIFVLDYMPIRHEVDYVPCVITDLWPPLAGCTGCVWPFNDPNSCNHCKVGIIWENQMTRLLAFDTQNPGVAYRARITVEPNTTVVPVCTMQHQPDIPYCWAYGLVTMSGVSYETHGLDVDSNLNVYIALKGKNNGVARYKLTTTQDPTLVYEGGSYYFQVINGWVPNPVSDNSEGSLYASRTLGSWSPLMTNNVTLPDSVIGFPDLLKQSMESGVTCQGCSTQGAVEPSTCNAEVAQTNATQYQNINTSLVSGNIVPGSPIIHLQGEKPPVYQPNSISTNITASLRFDYTFNIYEVPGGCGGGGVGILLSSVSKQLNITSYSNNLERFVEGGGDYFELMTPNYPERPARTPDTLPYLAYDYYTNRFFYKHFAMMNNVSNAEGNINTMGPPPSDFWNGSAASGYLPLNFPNPWCTFFSDACADSAAREWILNGSYRKSFQKFENQYYGYQYLSTIPSLDENGQNPVYGVNGTWNKTTNKWMGDPNANGYINPDINDTYKPGMIPLNNTINWTYPFAYVFTPATFVPNPLPFIPEDVAPAADYTYLAKTNVSTLVVSIICNDSTGAVQTFTKVVNNVSWTVLGSCIEIEGIAVTGALKTASLFIEPQGLTLNNGICFEALTGPSRAACNNAKAWYRQPIQPNTIVAYTTYDKEIPMPTRYPLVGEPNASWPSSLMAVPVKISGQTTLTLHGLNNSFNLSGEGTFEKIQATARLDNSTTSQQFVPDDPANRDFREIVTVSGKGYVGDSFNVYTDPNVILQIDNLTVGDCISCTTDADCPQNIHCSGSVCQTSECGIARHPSGVPCPLSFVCPRIDTSMLNDTISVRADKANSTIINIVGTIANDASFGLTSGSATLASDGSSATFGGAYSGVYVIEVLNAVKGTTLTFSSKGIDVATLYVPLASYTTVSSIRTILPNPRSLRISSNNPNPSVISYNIKGTVGNTQPVEEENSGTLQLVSCSLTGPLLTPPDPLFASGECKLEIDPIPDPEAVGVPFNIRIAAVPTGAAPPPLPPIENLTYPDGFGGAYPRWSAMEIGALCDGTSGSALTGLPNGIGTCFTTPAPPPPGYWADSLNYSGSMAEQGPNDMCSYGKNVADVLTHDGNGGCTDTQGNALIIKLSSPLNVSKLNISIEDAYSCCQHVPGGSFPAVDVGISTNPNCFSSSGSSNKTSNAMNDWNTYFTSPSTFTPPDEGSWNDIIVDLGADYSNVHCIGIRTHDNSWLCGIQPFCHQNYVIDSIGVIGKNKWVAPPPAAPASLVGIKFGSAVDIDGFNITAKNLNPTTVNKFTIMLTDDPTCVHGDTLWDSDPAHWHWSLNVDLLATGNWENNVEMNPGVYKNVLCIGLKEVPDVNAKWSIDAVGIYVPIPQGLSPPVDCTLFSGTVKLADSKGMCPPSAGPFVNGVWTGSVIIPAAGLDSISASNGMSIATSNSFTVSASTSASTYLDILGTKFTHVLSIEIEGGTPGEVFTVTTTPLYEDYGGSKVPEQIGIINVEPNDFAVGFHQNKSGTYIYSQMDSVELDVPDNNSLGLHDFQFMFYDRFNNTFDIPYTIWLRQPTTIILTINTQRAAGSLDLTNVQVNAQLLYQRFDRPQDKPSIPIGSSYNLTLYVENSSSTFYGDIPPSPPPNPANCNPASPGVCPNPAIPGLTREESNCSCPDWWDDPANPGDCIPNPNCHQYGILANTAGGYLFATNGTGEVNATFGIYGFGRRLMFVVFNGTRDYAPSIQIQPFYAGGMSIELGNFSVLEPVLLVLAALGFLAFKRKFNK
ncbi:hypothetical protein H0N99_02395 [Candidatus Micrarchaeota archaeon]|nr:hypothetical protein [Candidatus Micrarchaeota archaeon]